MQGESRAAGKDGTAATGAAAGKGGTAVTETVKAIIPEDAGAGFALASWDAPIYVSAEELRNALAHMRLESKVIEGFRLTDYSDVMLPEWDDAEEDLQVPVFARLTSPLVIDFTDGTQLEMFMQSQSVVRLSVNQIPKEAFGEERSALDKMFSRCIGTSIVFVEVQVTEDYPEMAQEFENLLRGHTEFIDSLLLCLDSGDALELYSWGDSGEMDLLEESGEMATIGIRELMEWG